MARSLLIATRIRGEQKMAEKSVGDGALFCEGLALVTLIVKLRTETMNHDNGNFSSLEAAVARPES
jgi:hypothetical protein